MILYQLYAFILPAFSPTERRVALPLLLLVPVLFIAGVVFCYFLVLDPALEFLLNFNADEFNTEVRARDYYSFVTMMMLAMGIGFQIPVGLLAASRLGIVTPEKLAKNRRYAIVVIAVARRAAADDRPGQPAARDGAAAAALRAEHLAVQGVRPARRGGLGRVASAEGS